MKKLTKRQQQILTAYNNSRTYCLKQAYNNCSHFKKRAENEIIAEMFKNNGHSYKIIGFNSCTFSCGYLIDTPHGTEFVYHTHTKREVFDYVI